MYECNAEVIVEVGVGRARWVAVEPWAKPPEASCDNCIALCIGRPLVTRLLGPEHCCDAMHCMHCNAIEREWRRWRETTRRSDGETWL